MVALGPQKWTTDWGKCWKQRNLLNNRWLLREVVNGEAQVQRTVGDEVAEAGRRWGCWPGSGNSDYKITTRILFNARGSAEDLLLVNHQGAESPGFLHWLWLAVDTRVWKVHRSSLQQIKAHWAPEKKNTFFNLIFGLAHTYVGIFLCLDFLLFPMHFSPFPTHLNWFFSVTKNWNGMENSCQDEDFQKTPLFCFLAYRKPVFIVPFIWRHLSAQQQQVNGRQNRNGAGFRLSSLPLHRGVRWHKHSQRRLF